MLPSSGDCPHLWAVRGNLCPPWASLSFRGSVSTTPRKAGLTHLIRPGYWVWSREGLGCQGHVSLGCVIFWKETQDLTGWAPEAVGQRPCRLV